MSASPLFFLFAVMAIGAGVFMVASRNPVNAAMGMIVSLVAIAADYFLLDAPFLGVLQILVQAGAVMVLFLFIIMLLDVDKTARVATSKTKFAAGVLILVALVTGAVWFVTHSGIPAGAAPASPSVAISPDIAPPAQPLPHEDTARAFGLGLFSKYMLPIQIAGFLLLSAMIGVVSLSKRPKDAA